MFKKIKGLFIVEEESTKNENVETRSDEEIRADIKPIEEVASEGISPSISNTTVRTDTTSSNNTTPSINPEAQKKFFDIFLKAIDDNNQEGFDYLEFKNALQNLSSMNMDENTRYQSALAMAKSMNISSAALVSSAKRYLDVLKVEEQKFMSVVEKQKVLKVTNAEQALNDKIKGIEAKKQQIVQLQKEIEEETASLEQAKQSIQSEKVKLQSTYDSFKSSYRAVSGQIINDIENIQKLG